MELNSLKLNNALQLYGNLNKIPPILNQMTELTSEQIEQAVQKRHIKKSKALIQKWIKKKPTLQNKIAACEWYKRLGLLKDAYKVIAPKQWNFIKAKADSETAKQFLWTARILNQMGAVRYAFLVVRNLCFDKPEDLRAEANIYLTTYDFKTANDRFAKAWENAIAKERKSYSSRLGLIGLADSFAGLKEYKQAIDCISSIQVAKNETLLKGILKQVHGEYKAQQGKYKSALKDLLEAEKYFPVEEQSADRAVLDKWIGFCLAKTGVVQKGKELFHKALHILKHSDFRPEAWLECYYLMNQVNLLSAEQKLVLYGYPDIPSHFRMREGMPKGFSLWHPDSKMTLMPFRDEWILNGKYQFKMSLSQKLLAYILMSGKDGISIERIKTILWPDDFSSFVQLGGRLERLLNRLRDEHRADCHTIDGKIKLVEKLKDNINVEVLNWKTVPTFYEKNKEFFPSDFADYYGLGYTRAHLTLKEEVRSGNLVESRVGKKAVFSVISI